MAINDGDCVFKEEIRIKLKIVWTRFKWSFLLKALASWGGEVSETKNHPLCGCEIQVKQLKNHPFLIK